MKIRQIEYFLEVEKTLNITKAAQNMYVSQTAVTKQLQLLEEELGFALFSRESMRLRLTEGGTFFKKEAFGFMHQYHLMQQNISAYRYGKAGCINIGFVKNLDAKLLLSCISHFRNQYPEIEANLYGQSNRRLHQNIQNGSLDIGFGFAAENSRFHYRPLKSYPLVVLTSTKNRLAKKEEITEQDLTHVIFDIRNDPQNGSFDFEGLLVKLACGYGTAIVHQFAEGNRYRDSLVSIPLAPCQEKSVCLIYDDRHSRARELFMDVCMSVISPAEREV